MVWFKVDDNLAFHSKTLLAGNAAMGLWVRAGSWSAQQLTEGRVPSHMIEALGTRAQAQALVRSGLWVTTDDGYQFWQWSEEGRQPTKASVVAEREAARDRQRKARERAAESRRDGGVTDAVTPPAVTVPPSRPVPTSSTQVLDESSVLETDAVSVTDGLDVRARLYRFDPARVRQELTRVLREFPDDDMVMRVATEVLGRAAVPAKNPTAYLVRSIRNDEFGIQKLAYGGAA